MQKSTMPAENSTHDSCWAEFHHKICPLAILALFFFPFILFPEGKGMTMKVQEEEECVGQGLCPGESQWPRENRGYWKGFCISSDTLSVVVYPEFAGLLLMLSGNPPIFIMKNFKRVERIVDMCTRQRYYHLTLLVFIPSIYSSYSIH